MLVHNNKHIHIPDCLPYTVNNQLSLTNPFSFLHNVNDRLTEMPADWNVRLAHSPRHGGDSRRYTHKSVQRKIKREEVKSSFNLIKVNFW